MATLHECLKRLPPNMLLVNLAAVTDRKRAAAEWLDSVRDEDGYELRDRKTNYGKDKVVSIGIVGGPNLFNQLA